MINKRSLIISKIKPKVRVDLTDYRIVSRSRHKDMNNNIMYLCHRCGKSLYNPYITICNECNDYLEEMYLNSLNKNKHNYNKKSNSCNICGSLLQNPYKDICNTCYYSTNHHIYSKDSNLSIDDWYENSKLSK